MWTCLCGRRSVPSACVTRREFDRDVGAQEHWAVAILYVACPPATFSSSESESSPSLATWGTTTYIVSGVSMTAFTVSFAERVTELLLEHHLGVLDQSLTVLRVFHRRPGQQVGQLSTGHRQGLAHNITVFSNRRAARGAPESARKIVGLPARNRDRAAKRAPALQLVAPQRQLAQPAPSRHRSLNARRTVVSRSSHPAA